MLFREMKDTIEYLSFFWFVMTEKETLAVKVQTVDADLSASPEMSVDELQALVRKQLDTVRSSVSMDNNKLLDNQYGDILKNINDNVLSKISLKTSKKDLEDDETYSLYVEWDGITKRLVTNLNKANAANLWKEQVFDQLFSVVFQWIVQEKYNHWEDLKAKNDPFYLKNQQQIDKEIAELKPNLNSLNNDMEIVKTLMNQSEQEVVSDIKPELTKLEGEVKGTETLETDDKKAETLIKESSTIYIGLRAEVKDDLNEKVLAELKIRAESAKNDVVKKQQTLGEISITNKNILDAGIQVFTNLIQEIEMRILMEQKRTQQLTLEQQIKKIDDIAEIKKDGTKKYSKEQKKEREALIHQETDLKNEIDALSHQIRWFVKQKDHLLPRVTPELYDWRKREWFKEGEVKLPEWVNNSKALKERFFGEKAYTSKQEWWTARDALNQNEKDYLLAYQKISWNDRNKEGQSRADSLKELTGLNDWLNEKELGTVRDFRQLAKKMKNLRDNEKDRAKYMDKILACMFEQAYYEEYNRQWLQVIERMQANNRWLPDMQPLPSFVGRDIMGNILWAPGYFYETMGILMTQRGVTGDLHPRIMKILWKSKLYKEGLIWVDLNMIYSTKSWFQNMPYYYPGDVQPSAIAQWPGALNTGMWILDKNGNRNLEWDFDPKTAYDTYFRLRGYNQNATPDKIDEAHVNTHLAYNLTRHWMAGKIDVIWNLQREWKTLVEAQTLGQELLKAALKYDDDLLFAMRDEYQQQADFYWSEKEKETWVPQWDRDISKIPIWHQHEIFSRAAVRWITKQMWLWNEWVPFIQQNLSALYCADGKWSWDPHPFFNGSNHIVWENMIRLVNEVKNQEWFATSPLWRSDFIKPERVADNLQQKWAIGMFADLATEGFKQIPFVDDATANRLWGLTWFAAKAAIVYFGAKWIWEAVTWWTGFRQTAKRLGIAIGLWVAFGPDVYSLLFGGKWGIWMKVLHGFLNKGKDMNNTDVVGQKEMLHAIFWELTLKQMSDLIEPNKEGNGFVIKPDVYKQLMNSTDHAGKVNLGAIRKWWSLEYLNTLLSSWLHGLWITPSNRSTQLTEKWSTKISDLLNNNARVAWVKTLFEKSFWWKMSPAQVKVLEDNFARMTPAEQVKYKEKLSALNEYGQVAGTTHVMMQHLLSHRSAELATLWIGINSADIATLKPKFDSAVPVSELILQYLSDPTKTIDTLKTDIATLYWNNGLVNSLLGLQNKDEVIKSIESKMPGSVVDFTKDTSRHINNPATWAKLYSELCLTNLWTFEPVFVWVENWAMSLWIKNSDGAYDQRLLDSIGDPSWGPLAKFSIAHFGYTAGKFELGDPSWLKTNYTAKMLETIVSTIVKDPHTQWGTLDQTAYNSTIPVKPVPFQVSKTGNSRP